MTQINSLSRPGKVLSWWDRLAVLPFGDRLFSLALGMVAPYSATIGARVESVKPGYARVSLRDRRRVRNHLRSIHAIALVNLGEIATGLAVLSTISADMRGIVLDIRADYLKKARGRLAATAAFELPRLEDGNTPCQVEAIITDEAGDVVAKVRATWMIGLKTS